MEQLNFIPLANSGNIYALTCLGGERNRILVATLDKQIYCVEFYDNQYFCNEINFAYIPHGSDIISIDAFERANSCDVVVGITFKKSDAGANDSRKSSHFGRPNGRTGRNESFYFNIYSSINSSSRFDLSQLAQDCQNWFPLTDFVPTHLTHAQLQLNGTLEYFWLLSGSDRRVHIFQENLQQQRFHSIKNDIFPEFRDLKHHQHHPLYVNTVNILFHPNGDVARRLTAIGCEDGLVKFFVIDHKESHRPEVVSTHEYEFVTMITSVRFFTDNNFKPLESLYRSMPPTDNHNEWNLLVTASCETPVIFRDILTRGLSSRFSLDGAISKTDIILSSLICDTTLDGFNEILVGNYEAKELLTFQFDRFRNRYLVIDRQFFSGPIHSVTYVDLKGDGIQELVVVTTKGISIRRPTFAKIAQILEEKLNTKLRYIEYQ